MKKLLHTRIYALLIFMCFLLAFINTTVYAEEKETDFMTLSRQTNIIINIQYDTEKPIISFIAPDGTIFKEGETSTDKMLVEYGDKTIYYQIPNAQSGTWKVRYDKLSNTNVNIDAVQYADCISISDFTVDTTDINNTQVNASFVIDYKADTSYTYEISAVTLDENKKETYSKLLETGNANANQKIDAKVSLKELPSNDKYCFKLYVYTKDNSIEVFDYRYSDATISYVNKNTPKAEGDIDIVLDQSDGVMYLDWSKDFGYKKCSLTVYDSNSDTEPIFDNEFDSQDNSTQLSTDTQANYIRVEFKYESGGLYSDPIIKEIQLNDESLFNLNIATEEITNAYQATVDYKNAKNQTIDIDVNGKTDNIVIDDDGNFSVSLDEFYNEIKLSYNIDEHTRVIIAKSIYSDRVAPILKLYEDGNEINVNGSQYIITGEIEPDCTLTIANNTVVPANDNTFSYDVQLVSGKNTFTIVLMDKASNKTIHSLIINRVGSNAALANSTSTQNNGANSYLLLIITFIISVLAILAIFFIRFKNIKFLKAKFGIVSWILTIVGTLVAIFMFVKRIMLSLTINSKEYFDIAKDSVEKANRLLNSYNFYKSASIYALMVAIVLIIITVLFILISKNKKPKQ